MIKLKDLLTEGPKKIDPNWRERKWGSKRMGTSEGGLEEGTNVQEFVTIEKAINEAFQGLRRLKIPPQSSALVRTQREAMDMISKSMQYVRVLKREIQ